MPLLKYRHFLYMRLSIHDFIHSGSHDTILALAPDFIYLHSASDGHFQQRLYRSLFKLDYRRTADFTIGRSGRSPTMQRQLGLFCSSV